MPDISMCKGSIGAYICPLKEKCYRHTAEATPMWQSYFTNPPFDKDTGECIYYWPNSFAELLRHKERISRR